MTGLRMNLVYIQENKYHHLTEIPGYSCVYAYVHNSPVMEYSRKMEHWVNKLCYIVTCRIMQSYITVKPCHLWENEEKSPC